LKNDGVNKTNDMNLEGAEEYIKSRLGNELKANLYYHGLHHTEDVVNAAMMLADAENISANERELLRTAALFHDSGFLYTYKEHEVKSCDIARENLPRFGYTPAQIEEICEIIKVTKIPQTPNDKLGEIMADADLDYLGRDDYDIIANELYREFLGHGIVKNEEEWNRLQIKFFETHEYFTPTAKRLRYATKMKHLEKLKEIVAGYGA